MPINSRNYEKNLTIKNYLIALLVLFLFGIAVIVTIVAVPYLIFLLLKIIFIGLQFTVLFVIFFWIILVILLWIAKLSKLM